MNGNLVDVFEMAKMLGLHPQTLRDLVKRDEVRAYKFGTRWRFDPKEVREDIREREYKRKHQKKR